MIIPIILCGGSGSRLFPLSRDNMPKQFLDLQKNGYSILQNTIRRLIRTPEIKEIGLISNISYEQILKSQIRSLDTSIEYTIFLEPVSRNTAPAIGLALQYYFLLRGYQGRLLFLPSDHIYQDDEFTEMLKDSQSYDINDFYGIVYGIVPTYPETGYGYIEYWKDRVISFKEKPDLETAKSYIAKGDYCWNAGMFLFSPSILDVYKKWNQGTFSILYQILVKLHESLNVIHIDPSYAQCDNISIDYALIEKIPELLTFYEYKGSWSDIGSFTSLEPYSDKHLAYHSEHNYVNCNKRVILNGIQNTAVVETNDFILVSDMDKSQDIKNIYKSLPLSLKNNGYVDFRPWGNYEVLSDNAQFKIKRILVLPFKKLSLQSHAHRCEHWVCLQGKGRAQINEDFLSLVPNAQVFINFHDKHRLINDSDTELIILEIQTGSYFGEDDIIRYDDDYGRA